MTLTKEAPHIAWIAVASVRSADTVDRHHGNGQATSYEPASTALVLTWIVEPQHEFLDLG